MRAPEGRHEAAFDEVLDALRTAPGPNEPACALCRRVARSVQRGLKSFFAEFVNDPEVRDRWRGAQGLCASHADLAAQEGDALAVAILYADLARLTRERWEGTGPRASKGPFAGLLASRMRRSVLSHPCPGCVLAQEAEVRYVAALSAGLAVDEAAWEALEVGGGVCIGHAEQLFTAATPIVSERLRRREAQRLAELQTELEEIVRKNDYRFRGVPWGAERDAWLRALDRMKRPRT